MRRVLNSTKEQIDSSNKPPLNADFFFGELSHVLQMSSGIRECIDAIIKKLELSPKANLMDRMEGMAKQIQQHEDLVKRLKEELREEKLKAKEEAGELAQEMAPLRYKMTCLLEEECKRRVRIEQASLHRIAQLEAQILTT